MRVNTLDGERADVGSLDTARLLSIVEALKSRLRGSQGPLWPDERKWLETELDIIAEELENR